MNLDEIKKVISSFPNNKAAGPDGFSIEFLKVFGFTHFGVIVTNNPVDLL